MRQADNIILSQGRLPDKVTGWFVASIVFDSSYRNVRDIDNMIKPLMDYIQGVKVGGVIRGLQLLDNDRKCDGLHASWGKTKWGCKVTIEEAGVV
jgi:Holliday junction resolvase RusA-like endonuclease